MSLFSLSVGLSILVIAGLSLVYPHTAQALLVEDECTKAEVIFARGSGQRVEQENREAIRFFDQVTLRIAPSQIVPHKYELGKEVYGGHQYPAENVTNLGNWNALGAFASAGYANDYGNSVNQGVSELYNYVTQRYNKCKSSGTLFILGGVSQGAQVIGQTLPKFSEEVRDRIIFTGLFGDPKLYLPEGDGWLNPPACQGKNFSLYRRTIGDCHLHSGRLGARIPYLPIDMHTKTGLWCYDRDFVCGTSLNPQDPGHDEYKLEGRAIDTAAQEAVTRLQHRLKQETPPPPPPLPGQPAPPTPVYDLLDVTHHYGSHTSGSNVVFVVDASTPMIPYHQKIQDFIDTTGQDILTKGGQYTTVTFYRSHPESNVTTGALAPFGTNPLEQPRVPPYYLGCTGGPDVCPPDGITRNPQGSPLSGINFALQWLQWKELATKSIILFTNNPSLESPNSDGVSIESIIKRSLEIDPVNVYPVVPEITSNTYEKLAKDTAGQVVPFEADEVDEAAEGAYTKTIKRPVVLLKNTKYSAEPGQEITFDASDSYVIDAAITKYEWDFNGDSIFEQTTTTPSVNHTYNEPFEGLMQVRVSADNNTLTNMSAKVTVADMTEPALPKPPKNVSHTIVSTADNKSTVTVQWESDGTPPSKWIIRLNDMVMGHVEGDRISLDITDLDRTQENVISIAGSTEDWQIGEYRSTSVPSLVTVPEEPEEPPITSTCTQSNFFVRLFCQAIALFKTYINGILVYFLPYRI